jgi:hypothetical protein
MKISPILLGLSLAVAGSSLAAAQDAASTPSVPAVLQITREYTKPYKGGAAHDKTESGFITAMNRAKVPAYYVGMDSMSGKSRALFFTRYASFAEWEKDNKMVDKNPTLSGELERAGIADGELLEEVDSVVYTYDADLSYHSHNDIQNHRYYQIAVFHVRPGHRKEWREVVKMVKDAHEKAGDSAHWGMYEIAFGGEDGTYVALTGDPSMSAIDTGFAEGAKFVEAVGGEEGMRKLDELYGSAVDSAHTELFAVNPKQSYVSDEWIKADSEFWKPKPASTPAAKPAADTNKP